MATALQCPECGHRHPLADLPDTALFRCRNCDRVLKVPESLRTSLSPPTITAPTTGSPRRPAASKPAASKPAASTPAATTMTPRVEGNGSTPADLTTVTRRAGASGVSGVSRVSTPPGRAASRGPSLLAPAPSQTLPWPMRTGVWIVALGISLLVTLVGLRVVGILSVNRAMNVFVGTGAGRFGAVLIVVPVWAVLSAALAHVSLEMLARVMHRDTPRV